LKQQVAVKKRKFFYSHFLYFPYTEAFFRSLESMTFRRAFCGWVGRERPESCLFPNARRGVLSSLPCGRKKALVRDTFGYLPSFLPANTLYEDDRPINRTLPRAK